MLGDAPVAFLGCGFHRLETSHEEIPHPIQVADYQRVERGRESEELPPIALPTLVLLEAGIEHAGQVGRKNRRQLLLPLGSSALLTHEVLAKPSDCPAEEFPRLLRCHLEVGATRGRQPGASKRRS